SFQVVIREVFPLNLALQGDIFRVDGLQVALEGESMAFHAQIVERRQPLLAYFSIIVSFSTATQFFPVPSGPFFAAGCRKLRSTISLGSVETGPSRHSQRIISGRIMPPNFCP